MAYLKVKYHKDANTLIHYNFEGLEPDDPVHAERCVDDEEGAKKAFQATREGSKTKGELQAIHVIQSWSPEESQKLTREHVNTMGQALAAKYFEGHQYLVFTHSHDAHLHNHIVVNPINLDTGKRMRDQFVHISNLRGINDQICRENGLSVINRDANDRRERMPDLVQKIERFNGNSYIYAMKDKADFARKYATSFDEYAGYLRGMGVTLRIKDKSITYFYEDKQKGKRGDKFGRDYTKDGLEQGFKRNHQMFAAHPELRARIRGEFERVARGHDPIVGGSGDVFSNEKYDSIGQGKDFKTYTASKRAYGDRSSPSDDKLRNSVIPIAAIRHARNANLLEYCEHHKIALGIDEHGKKVLKGREHIVIEDRQWFNTKNKTQGSALEFAAVHGNLTYLQAIARVNKTPGLLELEQVFGPQARKFTSFYIPRPRQADYPKAIERMGRFLTSFGSRHEMADVILHSGQGEVQKSGIVSLFPKGDVKNSLDFTENAQGGWSNKRRGKFTTPFFSGSGTGKNAVIFTDPRQYIEKRGPDLFSDRHRKDGILALMEPNAGLVENYLKTNPHVKELELVSKSPSKPLEGELDFFNNLKTRMSGIGVTVRLTEFEKALTRKGPELGL